MALGKVGGNQLETTLNIDSGTLYVDGTNNRVGVGTSSPQEQLQLTNSAGRVSIFMSSGGTNQGYISYFNATQTLSLGNASPTGTGVNGGQQLNILNSGYVTMPSQPAFRAYDNPVTAGSGTQLVWQNAATNVGGHYSTSTGRFTAPITGTYMFTVSVMYPTTGTNYVRILFGVNGTNSTNYMDTLEGAESNYTVANASTIIGLSSGDYVATYNSSPYSTYGLGYGSFCGFLIG